MPGGYTAPMSDPESRHRAPLLALLLAGGGLASMLFVPGWLPAIAVAAVALLAGSALVRRRSRRLVVAVVAVAVLMTIGLAGAWLLRARPTAGLSWTLLVLFALPLPLVPFLYWLTFDGQSRGLDTNHDQRTTPHGRAGGR
jgi:hypothetical protein